MGLHYPGGPWLARLAEQGDAEAFKLPRPLLHSGDLDFSFAGLKTAVLTQARKLGDQLEARKADLAASTQAAIVEVLLKKSMAAIEQTGLDRSWWRAAWEPTACCAAARCGLRQARRARALSGAAPVHRQRRDDRDGGGDAAAGRRPGADRALCLRRQAAMAIGVVASGRLNSLRASDGSGRTSSILRHSCDHWGQSWPPSVVKTRPGGSASASS